jgi:hypothetical protein
VENAAMTLNDPRSFLFDIGIVFLSSVNLAMNMTAVTRLLCCSRCCLRRAFACCPRVDQNEEEPQWVMNLIPKKTWTVYELVPECDLRVLLTKYPEIIADENFRPRFIQTASNPLLGLLTTFIKE